jgi:G3E family GTPase
LPGLERVVIETSGLADPAPILFTILSDPVLQHHYEVEHIITTVDAVNAGLHLEHHPETLKQIAVSDCQNHKQQSSPSIFFFLS